jgi:NAD(P)-dependent dehydrogenase (short-subunit alcohol dehydrogenase family)
MDNPIDLSGQIVLVTGGGRGVGRGISERFLEAGATVVICGRKEPDALPAADGREAVFTPADVRDVEQIDRVVGFVTERFGRLDVLVNNAGGSPAADSATASPRFSESIIRLNLIAPLNCSQRANQEMQQQDAGGSIINIASISALRPAPTVAVYAAAKAGLLNLTQSLAMEWAPKVRVNAISAGMVRTEQAHLHYGDEAGIAAVAKTVPLGRLAEPRDVGDACLFLASPLADYITGANILVHGGGESLSFLDVAQPEPKDAL